MDKEQRAITTGVLLLSTDSLPRTGLHPSPNPDLLCLEMRAWGWVCGHRRQKCGGRVSNPIPGDCGWGAAEPPAGQREARKVRGVHSQELVML